MSFTLRVHRKKKKKKEEASTWKKIEQSE